MGAMESLGVYLVRKREEREVSLDEMSRRTRIQPYILSGLERDDWAELPHRTFLKGFVRNYCRTLGVSDTRALELFEELAVLSGADPGVDGEVHEAGGERPSTSPLRSLSVHPSARFNPVMLAVMLLLIFAVLFFAVKVTKSSVPDEQSPSYTRAPVKTSFQRSLSDKSR
jgi:cytoskeletal protein RodZ